MPTGYTAAIADGIDFRTYALGCARAFGALIDLREEPQDAPIPDEIKPSTYNETALIRDRAALAELLATDEPAAKRRIAKEWDDAETSRLIHFERTKELRAKYEAMLVRVNAYKAPTEDHREFTKFMRDQIEDSIRFDCGGSYYATPTPRLTTSEWLRKEHKRLEDSIKYHEKNQAEEVKRAASRTAWIKALKESLT